jgi:hypothetical protein
VNKIGSAWKSYDKRDRAYYHGEINCPNCSRAFNWLMFSAKERKSDKSPHAYFFEADDRKGSNSQDNRGGGDRGYNDNRDRGYQGDRGQRDSRDDRPRDGGGFDDNRSRDNRSQDQSYDRGGRDSRGERQPNSEPRRDEGRHDEPRDYSSNKGGGREKSVFDD